MYNDSRQVFYTLFWLKLISLVNIQIQMVNILKISSQKLHYTAIRSITLQSSSNSEYAMLPVGLLLRYRIEKPYKSNEID